MSYEGPKKLLLFLLSLARSRNCLVSIRFLQNPLKAVEVVASPVGEARIPTDSGEVVKIYVIREDGLRIVANQVMEDGQLKFSAMMPQTNIAFQICANTKLKLGCKVAFTLEIYYNFSLTLTPSLG